MFLQQLTNTLFTTCSFPDAMPQAYSIARGCCDQSQDPELGLAECNYSWLQPIDPSNLDSSVRVFFTFKQINTSSQCGVICKLFESALNPLMQIINKHIKHNLPLSWPLGNTAHEWLQPDSTPHTTTLSLDIFLSSKVYACLSHELQGSPEEYCGSQC